MKKVKQMAALTMITLLAINAVAPAFAQEQTAQTTYTIQYAQVEQMVLNDNLQVDSNERSIGSLDNKSKLKKKYEKISDTISQTSASLSAIINNSQTTADLKAVAQGTNVALLSLSAMLNSQEEASDDDYELTELQANLSDHQLVKSAQSLFFVYYQLQYSIEQLTDTRVTLQDSLKAAQAQYDLKQETSVAVADAKSAVTAIDNNLTDLQNQSKSIKYQMNQFLGHSYNDQIIFGALPEPNSSYVGNINLENDIATAQEASYKVQISKKQRSILSDDTTESRDQRQIKSNEAEIELQNIGALLEAQYDTIKKQQAVLASEQQKLTNAKLKQDQAQKKYNAGVLAAIEFTKNKSDYLTQKATVKTASATLFWEIESYKWILKGLPAS
nr:hypothetical protein [uncultured Caproiciproducens sp.]